MTITRTYQAIYILNVKLAIMGSGVRKGFLDTKPYECMRKSH